MAIERCTNLDSVKPGALDRVHHVVQQFNVQPSLSPKGVEIARSRPLEALEPPVDYSSYRMCVYNSACAAIAWALELDLRDVVDLTPKTSEYRKSKIDKHLTEIVSRGIIPLAYVFLRDEQFGQYADLVNPNRYRGPCFGPAELIDLTSDQYTVVSEDFRLYLGLYDELLRELRDGLKEKGKTQESLYAEMARLGLELVPVTGANDIKQRIYDGYQVLVGISYDRGDSHLAHLGHIAPTLNAPVRLYIKPDGSFDTSLTFFGSGYNFHISEVKLKESLRKEKNWQMIIIPGISLIKHTLSEGKIISVTPST